MAEMLKLHRSILGSLANVEAGMPSTPGDTEAAWADIQTFAPEDDVIAALLELERQGLIRSGLTGGVNNEYGISTGVLAITEDGRRFLATGL